MRENEFYTRFDHTKTIKKRIKYINREKSHKKNKVQRKFNEAERGEGL